jgi:sigma54-dependent transcription regulator
MQQTDERDTLATLLGMRHAMLDEYDHIQTHAKLHTTAAANTHSDPQKQLRLSFQPKVVAHCIKWHQSY